MLKKSFLTLVSILLALHGMMAQPCAIIGAEVDELKQRLLRNKAELGQSPLQFRSTQYVPIKFHLVTKTDGSGGLRLRNILEQLCVLNKDFATTDIQFYLKDSVNFIKNDKLYNDHYNNLPLMENYRDLNAVNVWIVGDIKIGSSQGTTLGYYTVSRDWLVILKDEVSSLSCTMSHEIGHFFSLLHTFNGWDYDPWSASKHGNPAPTLSPNRIFTEYQDGSNCDNAGDFICDTPPDYNFGGYWNDCNYTGGAKDPTGMVVNPEEINFMSYFFYCERSAYRFSPRQRDLMRMDLAAADRSNIRQGFTPAYLQFSGMPELQSPGAGATTPFYNEVTLQWTAVEGATRYLIEIDDLPTFTSAELSNYITNSNTLTLKNLLPNETYYWRIRPFNENYACTMFSSRRLFKTSDAATTATREILQINRWQVYPNPAKTGNALYLSLDVNAHFEGKIQLWTLTGQRIQSWNTQLFAKGDHSLSLPVDKIEAGVYLLTITSGTRTSVEKIIIQ